MLSKARADQLGAYEKLRDQVLEWLATMETRVLRLEPVAVEIETLKRQIEELKVNCSSEDVSPWDSCSRTSFIMIFIILFFLGIEMRF